MQSSTYRNVIWLVTLVFLSSGAQFAFADKGGMPNANSEAVITLTACTEPFLTATVTSTKELSNIVVVFAEGEPTFQKFEEDVLLDNLVFNLVSVRPIATVYVKSGSKNGGKVPGIPGRVGEEIPCTVITN